MDEEGNKYEQLIKREQICHQWQLEGEMDDIVGSDAAGIWRRAVATGGEQQRRTSG